MGLAYHALPAEEVAALLNTSEEHGLPEHDARERLAQYGRNEIDTIPPRSAWRILLDQVRDPLIIILLTAGVISFFLAEVIDSIAILGIILLTILIGFIQEYSAERAVESLKRLTAREARVIREGAEHVIPVGELVPGDVILISEGDIIPADARIIQSVGLTLDESMLTGESQPVRKHAQPVPAGTPLPDRKSMLYAGTAVTSGSGRAIITATGRRTELGRIAEAVKHIQPVKTPLQVVFEQMSRRLGSIFTAAVLLVFILFILNPPPGIPQEKLFFEALLFGLSLAIAVVPSSLPPIVTISLSLGTRRLADKRMLVKRLPAAETLGSVSVICTDKTGTLTQNQMTVTTVYHPARGLVSVTGRGYTLDGRLVRQGKPEPSEYYEKIAHVAAYCNNARKTERGWEGDPTEIALKILAYKILPPESFTARRVREYAFTPERKMMSVIVKHSNGRKESLVKGAPEVVLEHCTHILTRQGRKRLSKREKEEILRIVVGLAGRRLLKHALAGRPVKRESQREAEHGLTLYGLVGMIDPPRPDVPRAIRAAKQAGIRVIMITGDNPHTARAIAKSISLLEEGDLILTGSMVDRMTDRELREKLGRTRIIARSHPLQKLRIVSLLQDEGEIVAVTGDGVNDAPALRKADIGIAMGSGTQVAKDVSDAILLDDNFASIISAIEEGRNIYDKIVKSTRYLISCNMGELITILTAVMLHLPLPLLPIQLLLMNLFTDGLPAFALTSEPPDRDIMRRKPRAKHDTPLNREGILSIILFGLILAGLTLGVYLTSLPQGVTHARSMAFTMLVLAEMAAVFGSRSLTPFGKLNPFTNLPLILAVTSSILAQYLIISIPFLQRVFHTTSLTLGDWLLLTILSIGAYILFELSKIISQPSPRDTRRPA